jgi:hypothetical protein
MKPFKGGASYKCLGTSALAATTAIYVIIITKVLTKLHMLASCDTSILRMRQWTHRTTFDLQTFQLVKESRKNRNT